MRTADPFEDIAARVKAGAKGQERKANGPDAAPEPPPETWRDRLAPLRVADLHGKPVPQRTWLVPDWIPRGHLTSLYGRGGGGKTTLAVQLGMAGSVGGFWLGMQVAKLRVLGVFCEDDAGELHRKLADAAENMDRPLSAFTDFTYLARLGHENLLVARTQRGRLETTPFYDDLRQMIGDNKVDQLIGDGVADLFGGNINDPSEVTYFLNAYIGLLLSTSGSAALLGHPNKAGTSEFTGCGAWENKPRARLYLAPPPSPKDDEEPDLNDPRRVLMRSKANYAAKDKLDLVWRRGVFRVADPKLMTLDERCELRAQQTKAKDAFLDALDRLREQGRAVSDNKQSPTYAIRRMREMPGMDGFTARELAEAMQSLFEDGAIKSNQPVVKGGDRKWRNGIGRPGWGPSP